METPEQKLYGTNVNETNNSNSSENTELIKTWEIEGTPFKTHYAEGKGSWIALGPYRLTEIQDYEIGIYNKEQMLKTMDWEFMVAVIGAIANTTLATYLNEINEMLKSKNG